MAGQRPLLAVLVSLLPILSVPVFGQGTKKLPPPAPIRVDFARDVKPILQMHCFSCHGPAQQISGLRLDIARAALRGGDSGPAIVAGRSAESKFILRLAGSEVGLQMPPTGFLSAEEIGVLRAWIDQGPVWSEASLEEVAPFDTIGAAADARADRLFQAIRQGKTTEVRRLLSADKKLANVRGGGGATPLMHAVLQAGEDCVRLLLSSGADPNARNAVGATALMWAATDLGKVRLLVARGAKVNLQSKDGRTALMVAARTHGTAGIVNFLIEQGAETGLRDASGATALTQASAAGDLETIRLLLTGTAEVNARANTGATAVMAAAASGCLPCVSLLIERGADPKIATKRGITPLWVIASSRAAEMIKTLLDRGADPNAKDEEGYTPLMRAAYSDFVPTENVRTLLSAGADVNARSAGGDTALALARKRGDTELVGLLLAAGAKE